MTDSEYAAVPAGYGVAVGASAAVVVLAATAVAGGWIAVFEPDAAAFLAAVSVAVAVQVGAVVWTTARLETTSVPLTTASVVTLARGGLVAGLAGFVVVTYPSGESAWIPALVFGIAALLDAVDGALARATDGVTRLGARLDASADSLAVLVGAAVVVSAGLAPLSYLGVGLARYAFVGGIYYRERRGRPVRELPPSALRRVVGVLQFVVVFLALSPAVGAGLSWWLTALAMGPLFASFGRDWLLVSGRLPGGERPSVSKPNEEA